MDCSPLELEGIPSELTFLELPDDAILAVFKWLDLTTLLNLNLVCKRLRRIANDDVLWKEHASQLVIAKTNGRKRTAPWKRLCVTSHRWCNGKYKEIQLVSFHETSQMPWLQVSNYEGSMFLSQGSELRIFLNMKQRPRQLSHLGTYRLAGHSDDIVRFVKHGADIYTGSIDRTVRIWSLNHRSACRGILVGHSKGVYCVDAYQDLVVSGSRDKTLKLWSKRSLTCLETIQIHDHVWSLCVNPNHGEFLCGTAAHDVNVGAIRVYDVETASLVAALTDRENGIQSLGAGILQLNMEDPNTVMSCGYDTTVRLWDLRMNHCVRQWEDPHDNVVYCIDSNKQWMILSGTSRYGVVRLWDKRMSTSVKSYFTGKARGNSPVYSLQFSSTKLYVALSHGVRVLDFAC